MKKSFRTITFLLTLFLLSSCINFYDLKNPYSRKESILDKIIKTELYLIKTGDKTFDPRLNDENLSMYITWDSSQCGENAVAYKRRGITSDEFKQFVPAIIKNMKDTHIYKIFKPYKPDDYGPTRIEQSMAGIIKFIEKEQKNIKLLQVFDDYICVSIKY